jgi:parallel beta-helix repeat protein
MAETDLTTAQATALQGAKETSQEILFPTPGTQPWWEEFYRGFDRLLKTAQLSGELRVYKDGNLTFGVRPGRFAAGGVAVNYAGATAQALTDNERNYVYLTAAGTLAVSTASFPFQVTAPHVPLAAITTASGVYAAADIVDYRGVAAIIARSGASTVITVTSAAARVAGDYAADGDNDQNTINSAMITAHALGGARVQLGDGEFALTGEVKVAENCHLDLGRATLKIATLQTGALSMIVNKNPDNSRSSNIVITGGTLDGNSDAGEGENAVAGQQCGVNLVSCANFAVGGCFIRELGSADLSSCIGVRLEDCADGWVVGNKFENVVDGINTASTAGRCRRLNITQNSVLSTWRDYGINVSGCDDSLIAHNTLTQCSRSGVMVQNATNCRVSANVITDCGWMVDQEPFLNAGLTIKTASTTDNTIAGNIIRRGTHTLATTYGLWIESDTGARNKLLMNDLYHAGGAVDDSLDYVNDQAVDTIVLVRTEDLAELASGGDTDLHTHALADGASDVTATAAELNKLDDASANVTATNLNALTGGGETALHSHAAAVKLQYVNTSNGSAVVGNGSGNMTSFLANMTGQGTLTLPANFLRVGKLIRIHAEGSYADTSGEAVLTIRLYIGDQYVNIGIINTSTGGCNWSLDGQIICRATGSTDNLAMLVQCSAGDNLVVIRGSSASTTKDADPATQQALDLQGCWNAADCTATCRLFAVEEAG